MGLYIARVSDTSFTLGHDYTASVYTTILGSIAKNGGLIRCEVRHTAMTDNDRCVIDQDPYEGVSSSRKSPFSSSL